MSVHPEGIQARSRTSRRALLTGLRLPHETEAEVSTSAREMVRLAHTLGVSVVDTEIQSRTAPTPDAFLGSGKLDELRVRFFGGEAAGAIDLVLVDGELSPRQQHTLERALGVEVLDRTAVILGIFESRARAREAQLEVEAARLRYELPRLREGGAGDDRHGGGGRGARGHTNLELEKERIRSRIRELESGLESAADRLAAARSRGHDTFRVALVGYTNAGKSSLMRGLTGSSGLVEDRLFATLGTTARRLDPPAVPPIVLSDTVGFVSRLPHELVASFRSTLDEAGAADHLLLVVDASDPAWRQHLEVTRSTLREIGAGSVPRTLVLNKSDRLTAEEGARLDAEFPGAVRVSAHDPDDLAVLRGRLEEVQARGLSEASLFVPFRDGSLLAEIHEGAKVVETAHTSEGTRLRVRAPAPLLDRWRARLEAPAAAGPGAEVREPSAMMEGPSEHLSQDPAGS